MNRIFLIVSMVGTLLLSGSCTKSEPTQATPEKSETVTFEAQLPEGLLTRSYGDGLTATQLTYAVYEEGSQLPLMTSRTAGAATVTFENRTATVSLRLTTGKSYDILFWADSYGTDETSPYQIDFEAQTLTVDYTGALSNDERRDAFYAVVKGLSVEADRPVSQPVMLIRPFAQLNVGTEEADMTAAIADGLQEDQLQTQIEVAQVDQVLHLMDGTTSAPTTVTFGAQAIPAEQLVVGTQCYRYLSMNYLLVGSEAATVNCSFTFSDGTHTGQRTFSSVPVQRNYRTNIIGEILTQGTGAVTTSVTVDTQMNNGR